MPIKKNSESRKVLVVLWTLSLNYRNLPSKAKKIKQVWAWHLHFFCFIGLPHSHGPNDSHVFFSWKIKCNTVPDTWSIFFEEGGGGGGGGKPIVLIRWLNICPLF